MRFWIAKMIFEWLQELIVKMCIKVSESEQSDKWTTTVWVECILCEYFIMLFMTSNSSLGSVYLIFMKTSGFSWLLML